MKLPDIAPSDRTAPGRQERHRKRLWRRRFDPRGLYRPAGVLVYIGLVWWVVSLPHKAITAWMLQHWG
jgi:hypothetical protein